MSSRRWSPGAGTGAGTSGQQKGTGGQTSTMHARQSGWCRIQSGWVAPASPGTRAGRYNWPLPALSIIIRPPNRCGITPSLYTPRLAAYHSRPRRPLLEKSTMTVVIRTCVSVVSWLAYARVGHARPCITQSNFSTSHGNFPVGLYLDLTRLH